MNRILLAILTGCTMGFCSPARAQSVWLDSTFFLNGFSWAGFSNITDGNRRLACDLTNYKLYTINHFTMSNPSVALFGIRATLWTGGVDGSFSGDGRLEDTFIPDMRSHPGGIVVLADGRVVVSGYTTGDSAAIGLAAYLPDGSVDPTFGTNGKAITRLGPLGHQCSDLALDANNKLVIVGSYFGQFVVARYDLSGAADPTFGTAGVVLLPHGNGDDAQALTIMDDGRIVIVGSGFDSGVETQLIMRLTSQGELDPTFNVTGMLALDLDTVAYAEPGLSVVVQPDGSTVITGTINGPNPAYDRMSLVRLDAAGQLDPVFAGAGVVITSVPGVHVDGNALLLDDLGRILVGGSVDEDVALFRFNSDGSPDSTFGTSGVFRVAHQTNVAQAVDMDFVPDDRIVIAGSTVDNTSLDGIVARFGICSIEAGVNVSGVTLTAVGSGSSYQWIDCLTGTAIPGATLPTFTPAINGSYAVVIDGADCADTSACAVISTIGVTEHSSPSEVRVRPSLVEDGRLFIDLPAHGRARAVEIHSAYGALVKSMELGTSTAGRTITMDVSDLAPGHYVAHLESGTVHSFRSGAWFVIVP